MMEAENGFSHSPLVSSAQEKAVFQLSAAKLGQNVRKAFFAGEVLEGRVAFQIDFSKVFFKVSCCDVKIFMLTFAAISRQSNI